MTHEFEVFRTYLNEAGGIRTYPEITADSYFVYMLKTGEIVFDRDHPDMYMRSGDDILIIEHFEFDSYPRKKGKGSEFRREESRIDRKLDELEYHENGRTLIDSIHGDAFLIATAKKYGLIVITEEAPNSPKKIPFTCQKMGIKCINLLGFMEQNGMAL